MLYMQIRYIKKQQQQQQQKTTPETELTASVLKKDPKHTRD